jgi:hypothetical protein
MANTVNILGFANTFGDWIVATNADSNEINSIGKYDWTKDSGTLFLNGTGTSVSVGNNAIISGQLQVTGTSSSATIDNNLTVGRQVYLTNTTQSLTASGIIYANGTVYAGNTGTGLSVSNNTLMGGTLTVSGATVISNTINVLLATTLQNTLSVGKDTLITANLNVTGLIRASNIQANTSVNTTTISVTGTSFTDKVQANTSVATNVITANTLLSNTSITTSDIQANTSVNTTTISVTGTSFTNTVQANTSVATNVITANTLLANTSITTDVIQSNTSVNTTTISVTGTSFTDKVQANTSVATNSIRANTLQSNTSVNTAMLSVTGVTYTNTLQANTSVNTAIISVTGTSFTDTVQANTTVATNAIRANTLLANTSVLTNTLQANTSVNTTTISVTGTSFTDTIQANTSIATNTIRANTILSNTSITTGALQSNTSVNTSVLSVTGNTFTGNLIANTSISTGTLLITGSTLTATNAIGSFQSLTTSAGVTVGGNFTILGQTIYASNNFVLNANNFSPITSFYKVNRGTANGQSNGIPNANGTIRWNETDKYWDILDVNSVLTTGVEFSQIMTANMIFDSTTSTSTSTVPTNRNLTAAFLQANSAFTQANTAKSNADSAFTQANLAFTQANTAKANADSAFTQANLAFTQANNAITSGAYANSAFTQANTARANADSAFIRANLAFTQANVGATLVSSGGSIGGDLNVAGNLFIRGNSTFITATTFQTVDSLINLAANNTSDAVDIGFYGQYVSSGTKYAGLVRTAASNFALFQGITSNPTSNSIGAITAPNYATLNANIAAGQITSSVAIPITSGGTGATSAATALTNLGAYPASNPNSYTSNLGTVTGVSGTAPVASTGGTTPVISMAAASAGVNGYMTGAYATKLDGIATGATSNLGTVTGVSGTAPVASTGGTTPVISMAAASAGVNGYMTGAYATKLDGIATGATSNLGTVTGVTGTAPVVSTGGTTPVISMAAASATVNGYLSSTDWSTFNGKQASGSYVTVGGALGTPSSGNLGSCTFPTLNQNTTGTANTANFIQMNLDTTTNATMYVGYASATSGYQGLKSGTKLTFNPSLGDLTASGNITAYSDERVKINWRGFDVNFVGRLAQVKSGVYDRTDNEATQVGVSAQSLQSLMPNAVIEDNEGMLSVAYGNAALVSSIELAKEVVDLKNRLAELERIIAKLQ